MSPRVLVLLLCFVNLVAGSAIGIVVDRTLLREEHRGPGRGRRPGGPGDIASRVQDMQKKLDLDADQAKKLREIYTARVALFEAAMKETQPRMEQLRQESDAQIRAILRPEQATRFDDMRREWQQRHNERERRGDRGEAPVTSDSPTQKEGVK